MRVTCAVREYVRKAVLAKVAGRLKVAEEAKEAATAARDEKVERARKLCEKLCAETQAKFVKEAKKLGLTFIPDSYVSWSGRIEKGGNRVIRADVDSDSFAETVSENCSAARHNPCAARDEFEKIAGEPDRIRKAANAAADRLLFELELGKVAKGELDRLLKELEVEL